MLNQRTESIGEPFPVDAPVPKRGCVVAAPGKPTVVDDKPFYPEIENFMKSRPVIMVALQGDNVVQRVRDLLGPTDSRKAAKGTIRGDFGTDMMTNVVHASDSVENANAELLRFFKADELYVG